MIWVYSQRKNMRLVEDEVRHFFRSLDYLYCRKRNTGSINPLEPPQSSCQSSTQRPWLRSWTSHALLYRSQSLKLAELGLEGIEQIRCRRATSPCRHATLARTAGCAGGERRRHRRLDGCRPVSRVVWKEVWREVWREV